MTPAQLQTLKTAINATPAWSSIPNNDDGHFALAAILSGSADPAFIVWRTNVSQDEIMLNGFDWTLVDNLSAGKARIWEWLFDNEARVFNPSKLNVRAGIDACWAGSGALITQRANIYAHCKRSATKGERIFATGTGTTADPGLLTFDGTVSASDIQQARSL